MENSCYFFWMKLANRAFGKVGLNSVRADHSPRRHRRRQPAIGGNIRRTKGSFGHRRARRMCGVFGCEKPVAGRRA